MIRHISTLNTHRIIGLAPMDGITNNAYRVLCKQIWDKEENIFNQSYQLRRRTEFMTSDGYLHNPRKVCRHLMTTQWSEYTIAQIYGGNHDHLLKTALDIDTKYTDSFSGIELNIGCPSPKIMSCEAGSGMLRCRPKTLQIIKTISNSISKPFSIKTRCGLTQDDIQEQFDFIIESAYYCSMITIHGRTYKQSHNGDVNRSFIQSIKQELIKRGLEDVKICWNGGLKSAQDWLHWMESINQDQPTLDGIMLGQAAMCNPWSLTSYQPSLEEVYQTCIDHLHATMSNERYFSQHWSFNEQGNYLIQPTDEILQEIQHSLINGSITNTSSWKWFSIPEFKKHLFWYVNGLPNNNEFKRSTATMQEYIPLLQSIRHYFEEILWHATF